MDCTYWLFLFNLFYSILFESSHRIIKKEGKSIFLNKKGRGISLY